MASLTRAMKRIGIWMEEATLSTSSKRPQPNRVLEMKVHSHKSGQINPLKSNSSSCMLALTPLTLNTLTIRMQVTAYPTITRKWFTRASIQKHSRLFCQSNTSANSQMWGLTLNNLKGLNLSLSKVAMRSVVSCQPKCKTKWCLHHACPALPILTWSKLKG